MWPWKARDSSSGPSKPSLRALENVLPPSTAQALLPPMEALLMKEEKRLESVPRVTLAATSFGIGFIATLAGAKLLRYRFTRLKNADWITPDWLNGKRIIRGVVTRVGDGDNFRLYHTTALGGHRWPLRVRSIPNTRAGLSENTIHIRLAGVDAPEAPHFGKVGQPFATESRQWLSDKILNKSVYCQLMRRDQYNRVVAHVFLPSQLFKWIPFYRGRDVSLEMVKAGWAEIYEQSGAEYGKIGLEEFKRQQAKAE
ncbi:staphylococcal nuclease [Coprinellus micaceus]|uniref:Staphylococcal nuclease n=1 Tax=Coprinellus micaceus TaxID=71717 RepID=A0A4Y7SG91_COPMI|nr:staphylococcal nuclease [Coprinellus micaceus]